MGSLGWKADLPDLSRGERWCIGRGCWHRVEGIVDAGGRVVVIIGLEAIVVME